MRTPDYDRVTEVALLAACMDSRSTRERVRRIITGADFAQPQHETVWQAMSRLDREAVGVDPVSLRAALEGQRCDDVLLEVVAHPVAIPEHADGYASVVHQWAVRRRVSALARQVVQESGSPVASEPGWVDDVARRFQRVRTANADDVTVRYAFEMVDAPPREPDWVIPGLMERGERLILTGDEGLGKSHLLRQFATHAAGGVNPFEKADQFEPVTSLVLDFENSLGMMEDALRPQIAHVRRWGQDPSRRLAYDAQRPVDITKDRDLSRILQVVDTVQPSLVVIGPLYRMVPYAIQTDDEAAPVLVALEAIRERGVALLIEAHAGHGDGKGRRDLRPRGSSALLGWPDFGYGMAWGDREGCAILRKWRGNRVEGRWWPKALHRADGFRWVPDGGDG